MSNQNPIIAYCGLVCSNCNMFLKRKCGGCFNNRSVNRNCKIEKCAKERGFTTCADCKNFADLKKCKTLNNLMGKFFGFVFRTNRISNLDRIREVGIEQFGKEKMESKRA